MSALKKQWRMTPKHPHWYGFKRRLEGPKGCNFRIVEGGKSVWTCGGGHDQSKARAILAKMGYSPKFVESSCAYFTEHGGHCDCEILFNVTE